MKNQKRSFTVMDVLKVAALVAAIISSLAGVASFVLMLYR